MQATEDQPLRALLPLAISPMTEKGQQRSRLPLMQGGSQAGTVVGLMGSIFTDPSRPKAMIDMPNASTPSYSQKFVQDLI